MGEEESIYIQSKKQCAYYGVGESVIVSEVISEVEMHARGW